jgi:hypothetical protein
VVQKTAKNRARYPNSARLKAFCGAQTWATNIQTGIKATVHGADADFARFPSVEWINPLEQRQVR